MNAAFFTEAGSKRGMGHLVRSYTIYKTFKQNRINADFLDSDIDYSYKFENLNFFTWNDFQINNNYDIIVIDSYEASKEIYDLAAKACKLLVSIDDFGRITYPKGIILNFAPDADRLFFKERDKEHEYLLGLNYLPIRNEFLELKKGNGKQLFIMLGGADVSNLSENIIKAINEIDIDKVIVVNNEQTVQKLKNYTDLKILYKPTDKELISKMANSSIAISTASMTAYELAYLNIPTLITAVNKSQKTGALQFLNYNLAEALIDIEKENWEIKLNQDINRLIDLKINNEKKQIIDGKGALRILEHVKNRISL